ncbi:MAG TPA: hypothetical protein DDZ51_14800 [Planctomycetaceae bacterium]|nr:hypothetical protein [Planctomycetaceae bacterium]
MPLNVPFLELLRNVATAKDLVIPASAIAVAGQSLALAHTSPFGGNGVFRRTEYGEQSTFKPAKRKLEEVDFAMPPV